MLQQVLAPHSPARLAQAPQVMAVGSSDPEAGQSGAPYSAPAPARTGVCADVSTDPAGRGGDGQLAPGAVADAGAGEAAVGREQRVAGLLRQQ